MSELNDPVELALRGKQEMVNIGKMEAVETSVVPENLETRDEHISPNEKKPSSNKILNHDVELFVVTSMNHGDNDWHICQALTHQGFKVSNFTVYQYRRWFYPDRRKLFHDEVEFKGLVPDAQTPIEYLEGIIKYREKCVDKLYRRQELNWSIANEGLISQHLSAIQSLKKEIGSMSGGIDETRRRKQIMSQVATICIKVFLPHVKEEDRTEMLKIFKDEIRQVEDSL